MSSWGWPSTSSTIPDRFHHPKEDICLHPPAGECAQKRRRRSAISWRTSSAARASAAVPPDGRELLNGTDMPRAEIVDAGRNFIAAQRRHMRKEEEHFLPLAESCSRWPTGLEIEGKLEVRPDPVFGGRVEEKIQEAQRAVARVGSGRRSRRIDRMTTLQHHPHAEPFSPPYPRRGGAVRRRLILAAGGRRPSAGGAKISQSAANYQPTPRGSQRCNACSQWIAPTDCKVVVGPVSPTGWCSLFAPKW